MASWRRYFPRESDDALDLLCRMIQYDPEQRITAKEALKHPYCAQFHDSATEVEAERQVSTAIFMQNAWKNISENEKRSTSFYRDTLYAMIEARNKK